MGFIIGGACIASSIWNISLRRGDTLLYTFGIPLGICCILAQIVL